MNSNYTFVTGYINLQQFELRNGTKTIHDYLKYCIPFFKTGYSIIFFCQENYYDIFKEILNECPNVKGIKFNIKDLQYYNEKIFKTKLPDNRSDNKDTHMYMITNYQKLHWMHKAAQINLFNSNYVCWIDFGINHMMHIDSNMFKNFLERISNVNENRIICPSHYIIEDFRSNYDYVINNFIECVLGSVISCPINKIQWFANKQTEYINKLIETHNKLTWESTLFFLILADNPSEFAIYSSLFNSSILYNYPKYIKL